MFRAMVRKYPLGWRYEVPTPFGDFASGYSNSQPGAVARSLDLCASLWAECPHRHVGGCLSCASARRSACAESP